MLATQIRQKDGVFYFIAYPAQDLLRRVRFVSRFYGDGETLAGEGPGGDEIAQFIARIEKSDKSFQRPMSKAKVSAIRNFYETAVAQPPIPGSVLLFTGEPLKFDPVGKSANMGNLQEPRDPYLIIDGQHRLAALHFYLLDRPEEAANIHVPCMVFDGHSADFATEMFVTINSTATRINKSHLIDLYERVSWTSPERKLSARIVELLYSENDSPLRYRINRLGGRSQKEKWILQAEIFNEIHRWISADKSLKDDRSSIPQQAERRYRIVRDFFKAAERVWGETWGHAAYVVTKPVTLKAMLRVCGDLALADSSEDGRVLRWNAQLMPWTNLKRDFRAEGFYERFPAKGQVERVGRVHKELMRAIGR